MQARSVKAAPPARHLHAVHQLPELDAPPRHDDLDVLEQVPEVTRGQRRTRHDHDERFAQLTQAREDSGKLTEGRVGHHALAEVVLEEVDVLMDGIDPAGLCRPLQLYSNAACPKTFVRILCD